MNNISILPVYRVNAIFMNCLGNAPNFLFLDRERADEFVKLKNEDPKYNRIQFFVSEEYVLCDGQRYFSLGKSVDVIDKVE